MHTEAIEQQTGNILEKIGGIDAIDQFYLAGGTALALYYGHRISIDLDFFTDTAFSTRAIRDKLKQIGELEITSEDSEGTLNGVLEGVSVSFFSYPYQLLYPTTEYSGAHIADPRDIAAMKIDAISDRGNKKDFIDLYVLLQHFSLEELIKIFESRYTDVKYNIMHILKSLTYFDDAEKTITPQLLINTSWEDMKKSIIRTVDDYVKTHY